MKKQLVLIGICVVFFCIELSDRTNGGKTNLEYLAANPQEYLGKTITIEGMCMSYVNYGWIDDNGPMFHFTSPNIINGRYRLTDVIMYGELSYSGLHATHYMDVQTATTV